MLIRVWQFVLAGTATATLGPFWVDLQTLPAWYAFARAATLALVVAVLCVPAWVLVAATRSRRAPVIAALAWGSVFSLTQIYVLHRYG